MRYQIKSTNTGLYIALLLLSLFISFGNTQAGEVRVVTTISTLKAITQSIGGKHVSVFALTNGHGDPHYIPAKPSYMVQAHKANLWIRVGLDLEIGYERLILEGSRNSKIQVGSPGHLDASSHIRVRGIPTGKVDRSRGDIHPFGNPHYWLDPFNARIIGYAICARLKQIDGKHAKDYDAGLKKFMTAVDEAMFGVESVKKLGGKTLWKALLKKRLPVLEQEKDIKIGGWVARMAPLKGAKIVTYHKSWGYFTSRFGLLEVGEVEPKPGVPPSPRHLAQLISRMNQDKVKVILMEPYYSRKAPDLLATKTGAKVVQPPNDDVGTSDQSNTYIKMIDNVITQLTVAHGNGSGR